MIVAAGVSLFAGPRLNAGAPDNAGRPTSAPAADEVRGLWVLRTSLTSPKSIGAVVREAQAGGFNTLLVQVRGRGEAYYESVVDPRASDLDGQPAAFDPLAVTLALAHQAGLRVHAWVNIDLVSSATSLPRSREHVVSRHPEWLMVPKALADELRSVDVRSPAYVGRIARWTRSASAQVEGLYLSPIPEESQDYSSRVITEIVSRYAVDGVHVDYARYPNEFFDYSARALAEFRASRLALVTLAERLRLDGMTRSDPAAWANMFPDGWAAFRRDRLTTLIRRLHAAAKVARPEAIFTAAVGPSAEAARDQHFQDWQAWASAGLLDAVCPMAYTVELGNFTDLLNRARVAAGATPVWAGIGAWQLPMTGTADHVRAARQAGVSGVLLFSYDRLASTDLKPASFDGLRQILLGLTPD